MCCDIKLLKYLQRLRRKKTCALKYEFSQQSEEDMRLLPPLFEEAELAVVNQLALCPKVNEVRVLCDLNQLILGNGIWISLWSELKCVSEDIVPAELTNSQGFLE